MRLLIVDNENDNEMITAEGQVVMVLQSPDTFPAIKVYPANADLGLWHEAHNRIMAEREVASGYVRGES